MRVIFDANIYLSYLLAPDPRGTIALIVETSLAANDITVLLPPQLVRETTERAMNKPYLREKILQDRIETVLTRLTTHAKALPELEEELDRYVRDQKDDYLVAYGLVHDADFLVTGDQDLLVLQQVEHLRVVTPAVYLQIISERDEAS